MSSSIESWRRTLAAGGQEHLLARWARLDDAQRRALLAEIESLDWDLVARLSRAARTPEPAATGELAPAELAVPSDAARRRGAELRDRGRTAFVLVAGGQATRLGFDKPKGMFPIGPASGRTLFEIHADRLRAIARRAAKPPLWFVMTSPANDADTRAFFAEKKGLGLPSERTVLFPQSTIPAFDRAGRLVLESPTRLFRNPGGHGGVLSALADSGFLRRCREEGVTQLFYWQVDNPLVRIGDPLFLGLHDEKKAGMSSKVVSKRDAGEKVGVIGRRGGRLACIEYSDLPAELRLARDAAGDLLYRAGNIAIHAISVEFAESLTRGGLRLPWHRAEKKVRALLDDDTVAEVPGVKFEAFVFDALGESPASVTLEVKREDEFAPVKNAEGEDSPATARAAISASFARWFRKAGLEAPDPVEVHPLFAFDFEEFRAKRGELPSSIVPPLFVGPGPV